MSWCHNLMGFWLWWTPVPWILSCKDREDNDEILWPWWYMRNCFGCINRFQRNSSKRCFTLKKWPVVMLRVSVEAGAKRQVQGGAWWRGEREEMEFWLSLVISEKGLKILQSGCIVTDWPGKAQATQETFSFSWLLFAYRDFETWRFFVVVLCFPHDFACFALTFFSVSQETTGTTMFFHPNQQIRRR